MWLLRPEQSRATDQEFDDEEFASEDDAHELQAKLDALRAADYRDQQRSAAAAAVLGMGTGIDGEDDLERMYDFSGFVGCPSKGVECKQRVDGIPAVQLFRAREASLKQRQAALEAQVEDQERKLVAAAKALQRTRAQMRQLTAQLGLKELDLSTMSGQVAALRRLLVEKERRLQAAVDALASVSTDERLHAEAVPAPDPTASDSLHLVRITEELTAGLNAALNGEEAARRQLAETNGQLCEERELRLACERQLAAMEEALEAEKAKAREMEDRAKRTEIEDILQQRLASRGKAYQPHLEV